jgi:hypothetical protein
MADPSVLSGQIANYIAAVGGLGTAAFGLVDATKAGKNGGVSRAGFRFIEAGIAKLIGTGSGGGVPCFGRVDMIETLRANWINGVEMAQQKAAAKALIRLYLSPDTATQLAKATGIGEASLVRIATKIRDGQTLDAADMNVLGRFDALVSAALDEAYERADQRYRNVAKLLAAAFAIVLAFFGGWIVHAAHSSGSLLSYLWSETLALALLVGVIAVPLAPVAKDLGSALEAAVKALAR